MRRRSTHPHSGRGVGHSLLLVFVVTGVVVLLDQLSKAAVRHSIVPGETRNVFPGVQLVDTRNRGVAFGFLPGHHVVVSVLVAVALLALAAYFLRHHRARFIWLPTGMLLGGALGNVLDRLRAGSVTDFVKLPLGWPPFNLADASITLGVLVLFLVIETRPDDRGRAGDRSGARGHPGDRDA